MGKFTKENLTNIPVIGGLLFSALVASYPAIGNSFIPGVDFPNHWSTITYVISVLKGNHSDLEPVFMPAYKLVFYVNTILFCAADFIDVNPKTYPSLSIILLHVIFALLVGIKMSRVVLRSGKEVNSSPFFIKTDFIACNYFVCFVIHLYVIFLLGIS